MKKLLWLPLVFTLAIGAGACNGNAGDGDDATAQMGTGMDDSLGTTGQDAGYQGDAVDSRGVGAGYQGEPLDNQQARAELPDTASWIPLTGVFGLLSMGGALGVRYLRRK